MSGADRRPDPHEPPGPGNRHWSYPVAGWDLGRRVLHAAGRPLVMGVLNLTPDSFHAASRHVEPEQAVASGLQLLAEGADLLDLGAASSRPGSEPISAAQEQDRLLPVVTALRRETDAPLSIDTARAATARLALDAGADAINDITGARDPEMLPLISNRSCGVVLMHMRGEPRTMQDDPRYDDVVAEVAAWLLARARLAEAAGIDAARVLVDPGIGFGKLLEHNLALLAGLDRIAGPFGLLLGASRKSFIGNLTGAPPQDRLGGSLAALAVAHAAGAVVVRVHDVAASVQFLDVLAAIAVAARDRSG
jgi:dihydropteroate synthase